MAGNYQLEIYGVSAVSTLHCDKGIEIFRNGGVCSMTCIGENQSWEELFVEESLVTNP